MTLFTGKNIEDATAQGLASLGVTREAVEVTIVEAGGRSFFGLKRTQAQVEINLKEQQVIQQVTTETTAVITEPQTASVTEDDEVQLRVRQSKNQVKWDRAADATMNYLADALGALEIEGSLDAEWGHNTMNIQFETPTEGLLIGKHGKTLNSLQALAEIVLAQNGIRHPQLMLNVGTYREKRAETLERLAYRTADDVVSLGQTVTLEPMPPYERKVIHAALAEDEDVYTESIGKEPHRGILVGLRSQNGDEVE
ncbi:protein jag [Periweissella cryptocerci]|uniref:RNA-binding protein KhpB n=1 Tax=Periweissella cryptocerci TaxID=2506420 RepID=A0A4V1AIQ0_9LACO|nr:RNA-binding cell elongation regulator Jag/EloR [Periweissella cryptocerci]QBO36275.1 protein jag [Periweissella cryptocerci]